MIMKTYDNALAAPERDAIELALDVLKNAVFAHGVTLANDDRAARAAEAQAVYIVESRA